MLTGATRGAYVWSTLVVALGVCAASPSHARTRARAEHEAALTCPDALEDGTLLDSRQAAQLARLVADAHWPDTAAPRPEAGARLRDVRLRCGPDLDRDGDREAIAALTYDVHEGDSGESQLEAFPATYYLLVSKHGSSWRAVVGVFAVVADLGDAPSDEPLVTFVRRSGGHWAIEVRHTNSSSDSGCGVAGFERLELHAGTLRVVESGDRSRPCRPCGCDGG